MTVEDDPNPFPGPVPYRSSDRARFFGRGEVEKMLCTRIFVDRCTVVFGPSGAGKSSLLQARVLPQLIEEYAFRVVSVDAWPKGEVPLHWCVRALFDGLALGPAPVGGEAMASLEGALELAALRSERPILIFLDQLEQLLFPGRDLVEVDSFFAAIERILRRQRGGIQLVLSLREDYLGRFRGRAQGNRELLAHGFRLNPFAVGELTEAVLLAVEKATPKQKWNRTDVRSLMMDVRVPGETADNEAEVQAAFAQIVCRTLWAERAKPKGNGAGTGNAEEILRRYTEGILASLGDQRDEASRLLEEYLVDETGHRTLLTENEARQRLNPRTAEDLLGKLETAAILRATAHQGSRYFELGHDWLARRVLESRKEREADALKKKEADELARRRAEEEKERERQRIEEEKERTRQRADEERERELLRVQEEAVRKAEKERERAKNSIKINLAISAVLFTIVGAVLVVKEKGIKRDEAARAAINDAIAKLSQSQTDDQVEERRGVAQSLVNTFPEENERSELGGKIGQAYTTYWDKQAQAFDNKAREKHGDPRSIEEAFLLAAAAAAKRGSDSTLAEWYGAPGATVIQHLVSTLRLTGIPSRIRRLSAGSIGTVTSKGTLVVWTSDNLAPPHTATVSSGAAKGFAVAEDTLAILGPDAVELWHLGETEGGKELERFASPVEARGARIGLNLTNARSLAISSESDQKWQIALGFETGTAVALSVKIDGPTVRLASFEHTKGLYASSVGALAMGPGTNEMVTGSSLVGGSLCDISRGQRKPLRQSDGQAVDVRTRSGQAGDPDRVLVSGGTLGGGIGRAQLFLRKNGAWEIERERTEPDSLFVAGDIVPMDGSERVASAVMFTGRDGGAVIFWGGTAEETKLDLITAPKDLAWLDNTRVAVALADGTVRVFTDAPRDAPSGEDLWREWQVRLGSTLDGTTVRPLWPNAGPSVGFTVVRGPKSAAAEPAPAGSAQKN